METSKVEFTDYEKSFYTQKAQEIILEKGWQRIRPNGFWLTGSAAETLINNEENKGRFFTNFNGRVSLNRGPYLLEFDVLIGGQLFHLTPTIHHIIDPETKQFKRIGCYYIWPCNPPKESLNFPLKVLASF